MNGELARLRDVERWIALGPARRGRRSRSSRSRSASNYPAGYELWAWVTTGILAVGALPIFALSRARAGRRRSLQRLGFAALAFDFAIVSAYTLIYSFEQASPIRQVMYLPLVEAALRYGILGAIASLLASAPVMVAFEWLRERRFAPRSSTSTTSRSSSGSRC